MYSDGWILYYGYDKPMFNFEIRNARYETIFTSNDYDTYEAALEAGLQECLTLLIEK